MDRDELLTQLEALHTAACGWAVSCCQGHWHRGQDVLQAAYVKTALGRARFDGRSALKTWWFGVIRMTAFEETRRNSRWFVFLERWRREPDARNSIGASDEEDGGCFPALSSALAQLSPRQAQVLHLAFYQELSIAEAAVIMGVSVGSARQHYERGKKRLRELLQPTAALHE